VPTAEPHDDLSPTMAPRTAGTPAGPGARLTVYLSQATAERIDQESRRLHYELGGVSRSRLVSALLEVGFAHFREVERWMRSPDRRSRGAARSRRGPAPADDAPG
jgi:hypothetical protein